MKRQIRTMDGNNAAAWVSYPFTDVAAIYPITPSSVMAEMTDSWSAAGKTNLFGQPVTVAEMQSEAGAAGTVHGSLAAGALTTTYTASQGLLLMIPNMYKIAGELLPNVMNVTARCVASHALSIFGDHSDIYACRQTGYAMLCSSNPQEVMDLGAVAHLASIKGRVPFMHFFDGFRTSHEIQKVEVWDYDTLYELLDKEAVQRFRDNALHPERPVLRGSAQNPDIFFQVREAHNRYYDALPDIVQEYMDKVNEKIGTDYRLFNYYGAEDAEHIIIAMGSVNDTIGETVDYLNSKGGKYGLIKVRLYRPFACDKLVEAIPDSVKRISVLDRTKESGSAGEPLYLDVIAALKDTKFNDIPVFTGRYGLGSKDTVPAHIIAVFRNEEKKRFTVGINDDVTNLSLPITENPDTAPDGTTSCKFWGLGSDGTVGANKNSIKIIGDHTDLYVQAYFSYDSKKSGGVTISHLRFGKTPIKSTYLINKADFVACHNQSYMNKYDIVSDIKPNGTFLLNTIWSAEELETHLSGKTKRYIAQNNINFYTINGIKLAEDTGMGKRINTILQSAFFKLADIIPFEDALGYMKKAAEQTYIKKGQDVVDKNMNAIDAGYRNIVKINVPDDWKNAPDSPVGIEKITCANKKLENFVNNIQIPCDAQNGDKLPVSVFEDMADGTLPQGSANFEKRGIAVKVPCWIPERCIQCNQCAFVCPHSVIRPVALTGQEVENAPPAMKTAEFRPALNGLKFSITVSPLDCTGCGVCENICPAKNKAIVLRPIESQEEQQEVFSYGRTIDEKAEVSVKFKAETVKGSQFRQPLLEFSGACAGCGETSYAKLVTQLFGERMLIANATGCSSIWGGSAPSTPYTFNKKGRGPAWSNSLFEDNAEFGYGMYLATQTLRDRVLEKIYDLKENTEKNEIIKAIDDYLETYNDGVKNGEATDRLVSVLENCNCDRAKAILAEKDYLSKKSQWIFGGDGWAYDIGFGGLDHVLASGRNVNVLVFDTEVYSNTGGQASKATQTGAVAKFAAAGKSIKKKDLAGMAMSYGYVYVAHVAMGADMNQCIKAIAEAEAYDGPSLIIAYAPCINHGIKSGMSTSMEEEKKAVKAGYWHLYRYNPALKSQGKNPFVIDSKAPDTDEYINFLMGEVRYNSLMTQNPERAEELFDSAVENAKNRYDYLKKLTVLYGEE
ncbi:MAG: pyruvate:ferredoxin (flavodoxin) oxidoreductase [Ruminococcus sp.]|nr:pyruvate:ferredoxin (flavodoxin) oxidoreductase [Ruminococcus sp.]MDE6848736.1 pyruvate:ferredoxin (flavodoxin) oxidoreductase [Ruminococcus sp.]